MMFLPVDPVNISFTAASTAFALVNNSGGTKIYTFMSSQICHVKRGLSDVAAATSNDFRLQANTMAVFRLAQDEGVRVVRATSDGTLQIGDVGV